MTPELAWMVAIFWIAGSPDWGPAPGIPGVPNSVRGTDLAVFLGIRTQSSRRLLLNA